jgi:hypothetical protein
MAAKYDPNCSWWDFSCTSNPTGCAWYDFGCTAATDVNMVVQPVLSKVVIVIAIIIVGVVILGFSPLAKRVPLPRLG